MFQKDHYEECIQGGLNFRHTQKNNATNIVKAEDVHEKDTFLCFDGNKMGNNNFMAKAFTGVSESGQKVPLQKSPPKRLNVIYDSDTVVRRRARQKDSGMSMPEAQTIVITLTRYASK